MVPVTGNLELTSSNTSTIQKGWTRRIMRLYISKPTHSEAFPPARLFLLNLPNNSTSWGSWVPISEPVPGGGCSHSNRYIISLSRVCITNISLSPSLPEKIDPALYKELKIIFPEWNARQDHTDVPWCQLIIFCRPLRRLRTLLEVRSMWWTTLLKNLMNFLVHASRGPGNVCGNRS